MRAPRPRPRRPGRSRCRVVETRQQVEQRRLPAPVGPQIATIWPAAMSRSTPRSTGSRPSSATARRRTARRARRRAAVRAGGLGERLDAVEPGEAAAGRGDRSLAEVDDPAECLQRPHELQQQRVEEDELARRQVPGDLAAADEQHGRDREGRQEVRPGRKRASTPAWLSAASRTDSARPPKRSRTSGSRPNACTISIRRQTRRRPRSGRPCVPAPGGRSAITRCAKSQARSPTSGIASAGRERQHGVDADEHDRGADDHHRALRALHDAPADEVPDRVQVVRRAREHLPGGVLVVERTRIAEVRLYRSSRMRASMRMPTRAVAYRRVKLTPKRITATTRIRPSSNGSLPLSCGTIASSITL